MNNNLAAALAMGLVVACFTAVAEGTNGPSGGVPQGDKVQQQSQDRLQTSSPVLDQKHESLPGTMQQAVQDMKKAREQYQQQLQAKKKELSASTSEERERLREQLRAVIQEQARDREQLRERLQALREELPSHQQLMEQAREQTQPRERRGD